MVRSLSVLALSALLAAQVWVLVVRFGVGPKEVPLEIGAELPFHVIGWEQAEIWGEVSTQCRTAFACSPGCPFCSQLAAAYVEEMEALTPNDLQPVWFILADSSAAIRWGTENNLPKSRVFGLSVKERGVFRRPVFGDVWASPMRIVFTKELILREARPQKEILSRPELEEICRDGGISFRSLQDLLTYVEEIES